MRADQQKLVENRELSKASSFESHINKIPAKSTQENDDVMPMTIRIENQPLFHEVHIDGTAYRERNTARDIFDHGKFVQIAAKTERNEKIIVPTNQIPSENRGAHTENKLDTLNARDNIKRSDPAFKNIRRDPHSFPRPPIASKRTGQLVMSEVAVLFVVGCVIILGIFACWRQSYATRRRPARKKSAFLCAVNITSIWPYLCSVSIQLITDFRDSMQYLCGTCNDVTKLGRTTKNARRQKNSEPNNSIKAAQPCTPTGHFPGSATSFVEKRMPFSNRPNHSQDCRTKATALRETYGNSQANGRSSGKTNIEDVRNGGCRGNELNISNLTIHCFGSAMVEPCGLYNGFNSDANLCFMNSALQLIFHSVKDFGADLGRCEGAVAKAVRGIGEAAFEACKNRQFCLSKVDLLD
jgi:hypothetical protein